MNNRRLARLRQLEQTDFFGDSAMRHRAPLLHYKLLGQYEGLADAAPGFAPGALLSESLMRYNDEVLYRHAHTSGKLSLPHAQSQRRPQYVILSSYITLCNVS